MMQWIELLESVSSNVYLLLLYSGIVILFYYLLPARNRKFVLLFGSMLFYCLCDVRFLLLLLAEVLISWYIGRQMECQQDDHLRRYWLVCGIVGTLVVLFFFKYCNFFLDAFSISGKEILIPLGISYYSFRIISYLADIYLKKRRAESSIVCYAVYVMFFPQMVSGPIARSEQMLEELHSDRPFESADLEAGIRLIVSGLFKKVVIADRIGPYATTIFAAPESYPAVAAWMGAVLYSIQLYCDFAGYSEIAIGITRCCGFRCPDNFLRPYFSQNMKEFWRRWHISLSSWLRDYIYIPCGGSRTDAEWKVKRNVMLTFAACGLWHGSSVKYLVWGLYHGFWNVITPKRKERTIPAWKSLLSRIATFLIAMFGWILFKAESFGAVLQYLRCMFRNFSLDFANIQAAVMPFTGDNSCASYAMTAGALIIVLFGMEVYDERHALRTEQYSNLRIGVLFLLVLLMGVTGTGSFLYANY